MKTKTTHYLFGKTKGVYTVDENGVLNGPFQEFYKNGNLKCTGSYKQNVLDGVYEEHGQNGLYIKCAYKNGKLDGPYEVYLSGKLISKEVYKDDVLDGPFEKFDEVTGDTIQKGTYKKGILDGPYESYEIMHYFDDDGEYTTEPWLTKKCTYKNGEPIGLYVEYYNNYETCQTLGWLYLHARHDLIKKGIYDEKGHFTSVEKLKAVHKLIEEYDKDGRFTGVEMPKKEPVVLDVPPVEVEDKAPPSIQTQEKGLKQEPKVIATHNETAKAQVIENVKQNGD